jgi:hypothetical protein
VVDDVDGFLDDLRESTSELIQTARSGLAGREEAVEVGAQLR